MMLPFVLTDMQRVIYQVYMTCSAECDYQFVLVPLSEFLKRVLAVKYGKEDALPLNNLLPCIVLMKHILEHPLVKLVDRGSTTYVTVRPKFVYKGKTYDCQIDSTDLTHVVRKENKRKQKKMAARIAITGIPDDWGESEFSTETPA
jgi:hypothetical protein